MEIARVHQRQIKEIINRMNCTKDFECYKSGFENLCKVEDMGIEDTVVCLNTSPKACGFSLPLEPDRRICLCPLRTYIAKKFNI